MAPQRPPAVVIVGFMAAGKSAVGRALADRLGLPFLDTDEVIAATVAPIARIFEEHGEEAFREVEAETVLRELEALRAAPQVLALGGGAVLADEVRAALKRQARVVWLTAPAGELWRRATTDPGASRPLARDEAAFRSLLASREPLYREVATITVDTRGRAPEEVAEGLCASLSGVSAEATDAGVEPAEGAA